MHVLKLVNKRKWSTGMPLLKDGAWISCDLRLGRWRHFQGGMPRPVVHAPVPWLHPMSKQCHKVRRAETWSAKGKTVSQTQTWLKRKIKVCKTYFFLAILLFFFFCNSFFCLQNLFFSHNTSFSFAILYFCLQNLFSSCNTSFPLKFFFFCLQKAHLYILNTFIFVCKTLFSFAMLQFFCKYIRHCFDSILMMLWGKILDATVRGWILDEAVRGQMSDEAVRGWILDEAVKRTNVRWGCERMNVRWCVTLGWPFNHINDEFTVKCTFDCDALSWPQNGSPYRELEKNNGLN